MHPDLKLATFLQSFGNRLVCFLALEMSREDSQVGILSDHSLISVDVKALLLFLGVCEGKIKLGAEELLSLLEGQAGLV